MTVSVIYNAYTSNTPLFRYENPPVKLFPSTAVTSDATVKVVLIYPRCQTYVQASLRSTGANVESRGPIHNPSRETPAGN